jgi:hypothetical protein
MKIFLSFFVAIFGTLIANVLGYRVDVPPGFAPGVKWQIEIQATLDIKTPLVPTDALEWDLDLYHLARHPEIIGFIRVNPPTPVASNQLTSLGQDPQRPHHLLLQRRPRPNHRLRLRLSLAHPRQGLTPRTSLQL